jgi:hypothetical protein
LNSSTTAELLFSFGALVCEQVLERHQLTSTPQPLELTAMLESGPLLARFTNRTVLEMVGSV